MSSGGIRQKLLGRLPRSSGSGAWARRKQLLRLDELPDDVLILILSQCQVDDIFALSLTCSTFRNVLVNYSTHIIPSVAQNTFPQCNLLLRDADSTFTWLKGLIPQHLAAILVDRHGHIDISLRGIPAEETRGDALRARVTNGWRVLGHLSQIAKEVYRSDAKAVLPLSEATLKTLHPSSYRAKLAQRMENIILEKRLQYVSKMEASDAQDYVLLFAMLSVAFRVNTPWCPSLGLSSAPPWIFDFGQGIDAPRQVRLGESWMTWFILQQGPRLFWEQWWRRRRLIPSRGAKGEYVRMRAIEAFLDKPKIDQQDLALPPGDEWKDANQDWHDEQRRMAGAVQQAIKEKSGGDHQHTLRYFPGYHRNASGHGQGDSILDCVPFTINFRTWKYPDQEHGTYWDT
ncbi:hypothetical protein GRF29_8g328258 [Pseudopithomyces chartarum]|uniref:F-box domain-containing protein n=1 Tax=Pseudopithomyces chartarum TaxID=1892770 RepID=A0AAN6M7I0_9PLEO|nr:hypothetical protein GRF29_8g328258 [Pseudopithomyces chartarum]